MNHLLKLVCVSGSVFAISACSSSQSLGTVAAGGTTYAVSIEGDDVAPGVSTDLVAKPTDGPIPTQLVGWIGVSTAEGSTKTTCTYDSGDGDFDCNLTVPNPIPDGSQFWFEATGANGQVSTGSINYN